jgi:APA family basic amino acid/polyamine antiporter
LGLSWLHPFSACAQLAYLVSRRRRVQGWQLGRDLAIAGAGVLFSMWVTFAAGYQSVYQALILVLAGVVLYAFLKARRENLGQVDPSADIADPQSVSQA